MDKFEDLSVMETTRVFYVDENENNPSGCFFIAIVYLSHVYRQKMKNILLCDSGVQDPTIFITL